MKISKYREKINAGTFFISSSQGNRIHDFVKGFGTISKSGKTILWDTYRKSKQRVKLRNQKKDSSFSDYSKCSSETKEAFKNLISLPITQVIPNCPTLFEIFGTQPFNNK